MPLTPRTKFRIALWAAVLVFCGFTAAVRVRDYYASPLHHPKTAIDHYKLCKKLDREGKYEEAIKAAQRSIELDPEFGKAYLMLGALEMSMGEYEKARGPLEKALELLEGRNPQNEHRALFNLGVLHESLRDADQAWKYFRRAWAMEDQRTPELWPENPQKNVYYVMHDARPTYLERVNGADAGLPVGVRWRVERFKDYHEHGKDQKIVDECQAYIEDNPGSPNLTKFVEYKAYGLSGLERYGEAMDVLGELEEEALEPDDVAWLLRMRAHIYQETGEYALALEAYDEVYREYYEYVDQEETLYDKSQVYREMSDVKAEIGTLKHLLKTVDKDSWYASYARSRLGEISLYRGDFRASYRYMFESHFARDLAGVIVGSAVMGGFCLLLFFLLYRVFFPAKLEVIRASPYRLRHLFLLVVCGFGLQMLLFMAMMAYDYHVFGIFSKLQVNPQLLSMLITSGILIFISYRFCNIYGIPQETWRFAFRDVRLNILLPIGLTVGLFALAIAYEWLLRSIGIVKPPPTYVEELVENVFMQANPVQAFLLLVIINFIGPVSEEVVFRVFMIRFTQKYTNIIIAVLLSCFVFTIGHQPLEALPFYFLFALTMALTYIKTNRIFPCIATHCLFNTIVTVLFFLAE